MPNTFEPKHIRHMKWYMYASYTMHVDCHKHKGGFLTMIKGVTISFSRNQKLNAKSSTKLKLIAKDDGIPTVLCAQYFLEAHGCSVETNGTC